MWILPKQLHTSPFVPDTEALISDLNEQSQVCAQSLLVRSRVSPARTWSLKWKRDSWTQLLSGRILKPSHGPSFTAAWTSSLLDIHASRFQPPASASAPKTQDTSGHLSQPELLQCDQVSVSLKTSRDISALGFPTCCKTWQEWVTERRGAWRQRVNAARLTRGKESLSWPTISVNESKNSVGKSQEHRNSIPLGTMAAMQSWPTPNAQVSQDGELPETWLKRKEAMKAKGYNGNGCGTPLTIAVQLHGQADPASSSSLGSRQGLWATHTNTGTGRVYDGRRGRDLESCITNPQAWATPQAHDAQGPKTPEQIAAMRAKGHGVKNLNEMVTWPTPSASCDQGGPSGLAGGSGNRKKLNSMLPEAEAKAMGCGKLNPRWVETLMGLPIGWTMPSCTFPQTIAPMSCDSSAMELCRPPQSELSEFSLAS